MKKKVVLLGDGAVGKTSLIRKFVYDKFDDKYITTIGTKVTKKEIVVKLGHDDVIELTLMIWDILGQKGYHRVQETGYQGTKGALLVCDLSRRETLESLEKYWIPNVIRSAGEIPIVFFGNKVDLIDIKASQPANPDHLTVNELVTVARKYQTVSYLTSAKTGENVEDAFKAFGIALFTAKPDFSSLQDIAEAQEITEDPLMKLTDDIIQDFCKSYGNFDAAMPIIRRQFDRAGVDIKNPTLKGLVEVVKHLSTVEQGFKKPDDIMKNRQRRMGLIRRYQMEPK